MGATLSENKLQLAELLEKEARTSDETPNWTSDKDAVACAACAKEFTIARRKVFAAYIFILAPILFRLSSLICPVKIKKDKKF